MIVGRINPSKQTVPLPGVPISEMTDSSKMSPWEWRVVQSGLPRPSMNFRSYGPFK